MGRGPLNKIKHILPDYLLFLHVLHVLHEWPPIMNDKPICDDKWLLHWRGLPKLNPVITWSNPLTATLALVKLLGDTRYLLLSSWHGSWLSIHYPRLYSQKFYYSLQYIKSTLHCFRTLSVTEVLVTVLSAVYCILLGEERVTGHPCPCVRYQPCCMLYAVCCVLYGQCPQCCMLYIVRRGAGNRTLATNQPEGNPTLSATAAARGSAS